MSTTKESKVEIDDETKSKLVDLAVKQMSLAYCPYSKYQVGCGILAQNGQMIGGSNIENASYGLTICAERSAFVSAVSQGITKFHAVSVATKDGGSCCGACRQFLREFLDASVPIFLCKGDSSTGVGSVLRVTNIAELLPDSFGPENLAEN